MNNMKKIGLSALAGSLVAFSANAVELSVSGKTEVTYSNTQNGNNGNPFGNGNSITFSGSGDMNGMTATYTAAIGDHGTASSVSSEVFASSSLMLDMGDLGTVGYDNGVGEFGLSTIDDKMPYAYEEIWTYTGGSNAVAVAAGGANNVLGYKNSFMGANLSFEYSPKTGSGTGGSNDGFAGGTGSTGSNVNFALTMAPMDGLNVGAGWGESDDVNEKQNSQVAAQAITGFATYAIGPATVGYQKSETRGGSEGTGSNSLQHEVDIYGISFQVNENLAVSYNEMENIFKRTGAAGANANTGADITEETDGIGISYTMGSASVRILDSETSNKGGVTGTTSENVEVSLMLAF
jgi:outer membrane protein OmpU